MGRHPTVRRLLGAGLVLAAMLVGLAAAEAAWADPSPAPAPAANVPSPTPSPTTNTPSPIPTPPPNGPSPTTPSSPQVPQPSPQPSPTPGSGDDDDPGLFDIPGQIRKAINDFLIWVAKKIIDPVLTALGSTVLSTPDLTSNPAVKAVWTTSMVTANALYGLLVLAACFIIMSRETVQTQYGLKEIAPRIAAGALLSNLSLIICEKIIEVANALTVGVMSEGVDPQAAADAILEYLMSALTGSSVNIMFGLLGIAAAALGIVALITFVGRVGVFIVLVGIGPIVLVLHATPQTEGIAYTWWRAVGACAGLQVGQAVIVLSTVKVFLTPTGMKVLGIPASTQGLLGVLVCITMLWLLIKLPGLMKQFVLAPIGLQSQGRGLLGQLLQAYITFKTLGAAAGLLGASRTAATSRAATSTARAGTATRPVPTRRVAPSPARSRPGTAAPVQFSHAPAAQTPLPAPAGVNGPPAFSNPAQPATPGPTPSGPAPAASFSHPPTPGPSTARPSTPAGNPAFSNSASAPSSPSPSGPPPAATFSSAEKQMAPRRPPAPFTPVFSNAPAARPSPPSTSKPAANQGTAKKAPAKRPTAARRAADPPAAPSPGRSTSTRRQAPPATGAASTPLPGSSAQPPPRPAPRGTTTPVFRPAAPPPSSQARDTGTESSLESSPPSPPPVRRRPRGGKS
ncbi:hypothetical protein [Actinoplanes sp. NPDC020271]|uniref:hypothetical protein n=1 Tax=Actinoplanes sp. NPDC020271 TaxID=3363896 RepID=UPI0037932994